MLNPVFLESNQRIDKEVKAEDITTQDKVGDVIKDLEDKSEE